MTVVTRFPPSPTGFMHIGTARTLLFNWLYARKHGGKVVFRIEDTDRKRYTEEAVTAMIEAAKWLGFDWDGDVISQYERRDHHADIARELLAKGKAYECYCTPEELDEMRESAKAQGLATFYDRRWRDSNQTPPAGVSPVIRIKAPLDGETTVHDKVQGDVTVKNEQLDDFILLRSDGTPTYMLAVVVDDHDMGVTHVIRGDDHLNNTFRQNLIYDGMGWEKPTYAHVPLILGPDGAKMSKRHGAASVEEYRAMGYLPEAMRNYLLRLGWSHGDDEIISDAQALEWFDLEHIGKSPARFDFDKLENLNGHYIKEMDNEALLEYAAPFYGSPLSEAAKAHILSCMDELKSRAKTILQLVDESAFFNKATPLDFDEKAQDIVNDNKAMIKILYDEFSQLEHFTNIMDVCKNIANDHAEGKLGKIGMPLRAALTGRTQSPSVFHVAEVLGKEETCSRLKAVL